MLDPGAPSCTAAATRRKVFTYAAGCWPHAYQEPFISWANRTTTGTPLPLASCKVLTRSSIASSVTVARPPVGSRVSSSVLPWAAACSAAAATLVRSWSPNGIRVKVTTTAGARPSRSAYSAMLSWSQSRETPSSAPVSGSGRRDRRGGARRARLVDPVADRGGEPKVPAAEQAASASAAADAAATPLTTGSAAHSPRLGSGGHPSCPNGCDGRPQG